MSGDTTQYVLDLAATLPVVISDTEAVYLYGLDIIAQQQAGRQYYFHDGLGSVRQLLDSTGDLDANYAYDPFGVPVVEGDATNPYGFTGEAWDEEVELLYLRARYYQPETGRFVSRDPWPGDVWRPGTLNRYLYVTNTPVNNVDPGGLNGGGGPGGICPECKELLRPYEPSGVAGPGKGPLVPDRDELPYVAAADVDVRVPPISDLALMVLLPHESSLTWNPQVVYADWLDYQEHGYSKRGSLGLAELLLISWFFPVPKDHYSFGPEHSLTQDVRHDSAVMWFKHRWAQTSPPFKVPFSLPHARDPRTGSWQSQMIAWMIAIPENVELAQCVLGRGSDTAEGPIDPVGAVLGSFDRIEVNWSGVGTVRFDVYNTMDRPSATRRPGTNEWSLDAQPRTLDTLRKGVWFGTTIYTHFYWEEPHPLGHLLPGSP
jgi:RHS repeat-associated protein